LIRAAESPAEQRHVILMQIPDVSTKVLRGAKGELYRQADASDVLSYRQSEIFDDPATPVGGNPHGDVTIVEFFDYRCPYRKQVQPVLQALLDQDHKLRFIYKEMPVLGPASVLAARAVNQHRSGTLAKTAASHCNRRLKRLKWGSQSAPIGTPPETKTPSVYQGVEAYPRWGPASALIHSRIVGRKVDRVPQRLFRDESLGRCGRVRTEERAHRLELHATKNQQRNQSCMVEITDGEGVPTTAGNSAVNPLCQVAGLTVRQRWLNPVGKERLS
jgi:hypothetical protein